MGIAPEAISTATTSVGTSLASGSGSSVALQAQLDRCTKQLGDWVNCSSGKTPEGKQIIQALQEKISAIRAQIQSQQAHAGQSAPQTQSNKATASGAQSADITSNTSTVSLTLTAIGSVGTLLNTIA